MRVWLERVPAGETHSSLLFGVLPKDKEDSVEVLKAILTDKDLVAKLDRELKDKKLIEKSEFGPFEWVFNFGNGTSLSSKSRKGFHIDRKFSEKVKLGDVDQEKFMTLLHKAITLNHPEAVQVLLEAGADPSNFIMPKATLKLNTENIPLLTPIELVNQLRTTNPRINYDEVERLLIAAQQKPKEIKSADRNTERFSIQPILSRLLNGIKELLKKLASISKEVLMPFALIAIADSLSVIKAMFTRTSTAQ